ncbi:MAG: hypothetical protein M1818_000459 [Claussenomyces sp. TS43310]|nr:MAG: hypothetical protein M1818_000459 [Claussenomyces sp. TS43310]
MVNLTCDTSLEDLRIVSEDAIAGSLTFHQLGFILCAAFTLISCLISFYLIWMHALHYTKPYEQRHIIRILFMVPVYAVASFLSFWWYWHAIYFQVISAAYEAFAIASFFALLCHYVAPTLHAQKDYFRGMQPIRGWVWPLSTAKKCCGGERGIWRTPRSGLTWFNIIWVAVYQYGFIRVAMTLVAVISQIFGRYCEASLSPVFTHVWVVVIEGIAVSIAMYCLIQFYIQMRFDLAEHRPFLKVLAIKLVIFLSFWQDIVISILTSKTINLVHASSTMAYPDISVGIPSLLLCVEMAIFSILHLFAFPYRPYTSSRLPAKAYPISTNDPSYPGFNEIGPKQGGFLGLSAFLDAMNPWDLVKAVARGTRWIFVGRKHRETDASYKSNTMTLEATLNDDSSYTGAGELPLANEIRRSKFGEPTHAEEGAGLIAHAQTDPYTNGSPSRSRTYIPAVERYDPVSGHEYDGQSPERVPAPTMLEQDIGLATSGYTEASLPSQGQWGRAQPTQTPSRPPRSMDSEDRAFRPPQNAAHNMLWGSQAQPQFPAQQQPQPYSGPYGGRI